MKVRRVLVSTVSAVALVPLAAGPASAAPPSNDESSGATVLHLGDQIEEDTTEATTNAGDDALNENCGAPFTNASVWFQYTPAADRKVVIDAGNSSYETGVMVFKGAPSPDSLIACGPIGAGLRVKAGKTYYVMAFSDTQVNGGTLVLSLKNAPPPVVHVSLAKHGLAYRGGAAKLHGTYKCKHGDSFAAVVPHLFQRAGRLKIQGESEMGIRCNGKRHHWSAKVVSPVGLYARGRGMAKVRIVACGFLQCKTASVRRHVHLSWAPGRHRTRPEQPTTARVQHPRAPFARSAHWPGH
jgi:hypothetical protein